MASSLWVFNPTMDLEKQSVISTEIDRFIVRDLRKNISVRVSSLMVAMEDGSDFGVYGLIFFL